MAVSVKARYAACGEVNLDQSSYSSAVTTSTTAYEPSPVGSVPSSLAAVVPSAHPDSVLGVLEAVLAVLAVALFAKEVLYQGGFD